MPAYKKRQQIEEIPNQKSSAFLQFQKNKLFLKLDKNPVVQHFLKSVYSFENIKVLKAKY